MEEAAVSRTTVDSRDGLLFGQPAKRVQLTCSHGESSFFVLPGRKAQDERATLEFLWARHAGKHHCRCTAPAFSMGV